MSKKLYVGNLPFSLTETQLQDMFAAHGEVTSSKVITDRLSGRSRGFGFVEMANDAEATAAIEKMHDKDIEGRKLMVNEARPMESRSGGFDRERR